MVEPYAFLPVLFWYLHNGSNILCYRFPECSKSFCIRLGACWCSKNQSAQWFESIFDVSNLLKTSQLGAQSAAYISCTCSITSGDANDFVSSTKAFSFPSTIFSSNASTLLGTSIGAGGGGGGGGGGGALKPSESPLSSILSAPFGGELPAWAIVKSSRREVAASRL